MKSATFMAPYRALLRAIPALLHGRRATLCALISRPWRDRRTTRGGRAEAQNHQWLAGIGGDGTQAPPRPFCLMPRCEASRMRGILSLQRSAMMKNLFVTIGLATALTCAAPAAWAQSKGGEQFLKKAIEANYAEIEMGKLAQQKGAGEGVRSFGKQLEQDHSAANTKAMNVAKQMGMTPPTGPNKKQQADYDRMSKMSGEQFDKAFVKHMVADHKKDIKEFQKEAKTNEPPSSFANEVLPDLQKHLQAAQSLQGKSGTTGSR